MSEAGEDEVVAQGVETGTGARFQSSGEGPALQRPDASIEQAYRSRVALFTAYLRTGGCVPLHEWLRLPAADVQALSEAAAIVQGERAGMLAEAIISALAVVSERATPDPLEAAGRSALVEAGGPPA